MEETDQFAYRACHGNWRNFVRGRRTSAAATADLQSKDRGATLNSLLTILHRLGTAYRLGRMRYRQRRQLFEMDDGQLKDIGITREQAEQEARKPIWKA